MPRHLLIKLTKTKHEERMLKAASNIQGKLHMLNSYLSAETPQARREWQDIFKALKGKSLQPRLLYSARTSFKTDGETKSFSDK